MRTPLFRGLFIRPGEKTTWDGKPLPGKWVYGGIFANEIGPDSPDDPPDQPKRSTTYAIIYQREPEIAKFPVYADSVGEYTGMLDKDGNMIFEGDIIELEVVETVCAVVEYCDAAFGIQFDGEFFPFFSLPVMKQKLRVIGNIYESPELMEATSNETR